MEAANDVEKIVGGTIGAVLLVVLVLALGLLYKNRTHALRFALSFFQREFLLVVKTMAELWDVTSDRTRSAKPTVLCEHHQIVSILSYTWVRVRVRRHRSLSHLQPGEPFRPSAGSRPACPPR